MRWSFNKKRFICVNFCSTEIFVTCVYLSTNQQYNYYNYLFNRFVAVKRYKKILQNPLLSNCLLRDCFVNTVTLLKITLTLFATVEYGKFGGLARTNQILFIEIMSVLLGELTAVAVAQ